MSRLDERRRTARRLLRDHHAEITPDPAFADRVVARIAEQPSAQIGPYAARLLPATLALLLVLAWVSWQVGVDPEVLVVESPLEAPLSWIVEDPRERIVKRSLAFISTTGLFVVGVLVGALGTHLYYAQMLREPGRPRSFMAGKQADRLQRELELTVEQRRSIDAILEERHVEIEALRRELSPRVHESMERTRQLIHEVLTEQQRERFDELQARHPRRWDHFLMGRGAGPPPDRPRRGGR